MSAYDPTWESLERHTVPQWFRDDPFGIYFHWGPYAVPAYGTEWYPHYMYEAGHHIHDHHVETYGDPAEFGYHDFVPDFTADRFDADRWADLCANAGAEYVGITAIHHDGFALWDSDVAEWNAANMGPERDVVGELAEAVRARGMRFFTTFHHAMNWWYYPRDDDVHTTDPEYAGLYGPPHDEGEDPPETYVERWRDLTIEVIDTYRPDLVWFDAGWGFDEFLEYDEYRRDVVAHYYNRALEWGKEVDVCHKAGIPPSVGIVDYERSRREERSLTPWVTDTSIDRASWSYVVESDFKSVDTMLTGFVDRLSKNGNTLLNVGPKPDGTIPEAAAERLLEIGDWLETNRDAVTGSRPGWTFGEGPTDVTAGEFEEASSVTFTGEDVRFLRTGETTAVIALEWPTDGRLDLETSLDRVCSRWTHRQPAIEEISLLGAPDVDVRWEVSRNEDADWSPVEHDDEREARLRIELPSDPPSALDHAYAVCVRLADESGDV